MSSMYEVSEEGRAQYADHEAEMGASYRVGSVIEYVAFGGSARLVRVTHKDVDIKNGRPGFDGDLVNGRIDGFDGVWGYDSQITKVVEF